MKAGCLITSVIAFVYACTPPVVPAVTVDLRNEVIGRSPRYIGAVEGGTFSVPFMADCGINTYRLYADMHRIEPVDDDGMYGSPSIDAIKADPGCINWAWWDSALTNSSWWWYAPGFGGYVEDLKAHGIEPLICLRNKDDQGRPAWAPPRNGWDEADWNEWWGFCFAVAYWCNVRNNLGVTRFEILNEPDLPAQGWSGTPAQYRELTARSADALRFANGLAGLPVVIHAPAVANCASPYLHDAAGASDAHVDAVSYHTYACDAGPTARHVKGDVRDLDRDGVIEPVWVTEWGTYAGSYDTVSRAAATCRQMYDLAAEGVEGLCIFPFFEWGGFSGLISAQGAKSETYFAYRLMCRGLSGAGEVLRADSSAPAKKVMTVRDDATVRVVAVDAGETVTVRLGGIGIETGTFTVYEYSAAVKDAIVLSGAFAGGSVSFSAPAEGAACAVVYPDAPLESFAVSAWVPTSWDAENARASFRANWDLITEASAFWYEMTAEGTLVPYEGARDATFVSEAHDAGILVLPTITNAFEGTRVAAVVNDRAKAKAHIQAILDEMVSCGYDGIDIDYEGIAAADRDAFTAFIRRLSETLRARGKLLAVCVQAKTSEPGEDWGPAAQDWFRLASFADRLRVMTYDYHWGSGNAGPVAPVWWVDEVLSFAGSVVPKAATQMGIPFYGYDWPRKNPNEDNSLTWLGVQNLVAAYSPALRWDAEAQEPWFTYVKPPNKLHEVWYQDSASVRAKVDEAMARGVGGVAIWRLGSEDPGVWGVLRDHDSDGDGLTLLQERAARTDPGRFDTDGGDTSDLAELHDGTDPRDASDDLDGDWDGDGLTSRDELEQYHTDPRNDDHDGDGLDDGEEILIFLTSATSPDSDNDGYSDYIEARCGWDTGEGAPSGGVRVNFQPAVNSKNPSGFCVDAADSPSPRGYGWV